MKNDSSSTQTELYNRVLQLLQREWVGLATDIDGTLSPIAATHDAAFVPERGRNTLQQLHTLGRFTITIVISGRGAEGAYKLVGLPGLLYLGNHGLDMLHPDELKAVPHPYAQPYQAAIAATLQTLQARLKTISNPIQETSVENWRNGLLFENKGVTASIHYRLSPNPILAHQYLLQLLQEIVPTTGLQIREGRMVIELRPPLEINKGTALLDVIETYKLQGLIYLGDDTTDADAFEALHHYAQTHPLFADLAIGVHSPEMPDIIAETADFLVEGVEGVEEFLVWLNTILSS